MTTSTSIWTTDDVTALRRAIGLGVTRVRYPDGREINYRSLADMNALLRAMLAEVDPLSASPSVAFAEFTRD